MKILKHIAIFALIFLVTTIGIELLARWTFVANLSSTDFYEDIGRGRKRNSQFVFFNEGFGIKYYNNKRYSGQEFPYEKQKNSMRVALLGDSFVESVHVFERDYFGTKLASMLEESHPDSKIEVMNFGRSGFGLKNMYAYYETLVKQFDPDIVLFMISDKDIWSNNADPLLPGVETENDKLIVDLAFNPKKVKTYEKVEFFVQNSVIINMLNNCLKKSKKVPVGSILFDKLYFYFANVSEDSFDSQDDDSQTSKVDSTTELMLKSMDSQKVLFVNRDLEKLSKPFEELLRESKLSLIELGPGLKSMADEGRDPYYWNVTKKRGHWNHDAHIAVAEQLAPKISERIRTLKED